MAEYANREHYIPLRQTDLVALLTREIGDSPDAVAALKRLDALLSATFHYEYYRLLQELKDEYAPFDPDAVTVSLNPIDADQRRQRLDRLFDRFLFLMERANFKRLTLDEVKALAGEVSEWGLNMDVDFSMFEKLEVFVRGDTIGTRYRQHWLLFWKREEVRVPIFKRLVLFVKLKSSKRLPASIDTKDVFLKVFKDIPRSIWRCSSRAQPCACPTFIASSSVGHWSAAGHGSSTRSSDSLPT